MNIPKPNPEVYRLAAELIANGSEKYSCIAITSASREIGISDSGGWSMHRLQYMAMFGPYKLDTMHILKYSCTPDYWYIIDAECDNSREHSFWNKLPTPTRQSDRILALLMMAEIVEQGCA